jgi:hypothetical protein
MKNRFVGGVSLRLVVSLLIAIFGFASGIRAQTLDFQIMVNGSWDYVLDPNPGYDIYSQTPSGQRIILVAPADKHIASVFGDPNAATSHPYNPTGLQPSSVGKIELYYLDFQPGIQFQLSSPTDEEPAHFDAAEGTVPLSIIQKVLYMPDPKQPRFAISLPMPDSISTYTGEYGSGYAYSKMSKQHIDHGTPNMPYSIWAVLHYSLKSYSKLLALRESNAQGSVPKPESADIPIGDDGIRQAVSILVGEIPHTPNDPTCDSLSAWTFSTAMKMWGLQSRARFPVLDQSSGDQYSYFDYACTEATATNADILQNHLDDLATTSDAIKALHEKLGSLVSAEDQYRSDKTKMADLQTSFNRVRKLTGLMMGKSRADIDEALSCTQALINNDKDKIDGCPTKKSLNERYFGDGGTFHARTVGSTDCHKGPLSINNAFAGISN